MISGFMCKGKNLYILMIFVSIIILLFFILKSTKNSQNSFDSENKALGNTDAAFNAPSSVPVNLETTKIEKEIEDTDNFDIIKENIPNAIFF